MYMSVSGTGIFWSHLKTGTASATFHSFDTEAVSSKKPHAKIRSSAVLFLAFLHAVKDPLSQNNFCYFCYNFFCNTCMWLCRPFGILQTSIVFPVGSFFAGWRILVSSAAIILKLFHGLIEPSQLSLNLYTSDERSKLYKEESGVGNCTEQSQQQPLLPEVMQKTTGSCLGILCLQTQYY